MLTLLERRVFEYLGAPSWEDTLANRITIWRCRVGVVGTLGFFVLYLVTGWMTPLVMVFVTFVAAAVADAVDGHIARRSGQTKFGAFIDPAADKFISYAGGIVLFASYALSPQPWMVTAIVFLTYDKAVMGLRRLDANLRTLRVAKIKSLFLFTGFGTLLFGVYAEQAHWHSLFRFTQWFGTDMLCIAAFLCLVAGVLYGLFFKRPHIRQRVEAGFNRNKVLAFLL